MPPVAFGPFTFDREERTLRRADAVVPLSPKIADALAALLDEPGALVSKEAMRERLWPEGFVEDGNLTQTIYLLRKTLDPSGDGRAFIETVPRRGYRFVAPVTAVLLPAAAQTIVQPVPASRNVLRFALAFVATFAVIIGSIFATAQSHSGTYPGLSVEASRAYALGHYYWDKRTLDGTHRAIAYYEEVVRLAPRSALGYAGLAEANVMIANHAMVGGDLKKYYAKAEAYARAGLQVDPQSGEAQAILGFITSDRDMNPTLAEKQLRTAIALQPSYAEAHEFLGVVLFDRGKIGEANVELARAAALDPLSPPILRWLGVSSYYERDLRGAKRALQQALDLDRSDHMAAFYLIRIEEQLGETREATRLLADETQRIASMKHHASYSDVELRALRALVALRAGDVQLAKRVMPNLTPTPKPAKDFDVTVLAALNLQMGRREDAVKWLRIGLRENKEKNLRELIARDPELGGVCSERSASVC